jgi:AcrR family transcriptional regulator
MDLAVVVHGNDELAATIIHRFAEVLGRTAREQLLQLLRHFLESFLHWVNFKLTTDATAITFSQLLERAMRGMSAIIAHLNRQFGKKCITNR